MTATCEFVEGLLYRGEAILRAGPAKAGADSPSDPALLALLEKAFARHALDVPGEPIALVPEVALRAADFVEHACLLLVAPHAPREGLGKRREALGLPRTPADHLSADLFLRYVPLIRRRARALETTDPLVAHVDAVLRAFPLSGVLSDLTEGPFALDFAHDGLALLYAERIAATERLGWAPKEGTRERAHLELVLADQGRSSSPLLAPEPPPRVPDELPLTEEVPPDE